MQIIYQLQLNYIFRMIVACVCGIAIGLERKNRAKEAGIRTHCVVACAAALMMIVSKYAFYDVDGADPSRIASQIVTGIGFLGAGMIFVHRQTVTGLTTAAGIWATSGIGMAIGSGMYIVGVSATIIILIAQIMLHANAPWLQTPKTKTLIINSVKSNEFQLELVKKLTDKKINIFETNIRKTDDGYEYTVSIDIPHDILENDIVNLFEESCSIKSN